MTREPNPTRSWRHGRSPQRGVVLIFTLIVLLILTIGAVALMRSMNTALVGSGNLAFRRDLVNQGEYAVSQVMAEFQTGGDLSTSASTLNNVPADNYSATMLTTNAEGVPTALLQNTLPASVGTHADLTNPNSSDISIRYVIDRLCSASGTPTGTLCVQSSAAPTGGTAGNTATVKPPTATVYRLSVRVTGARSTQVFLQTTFTRPD
jgi:Tfp pilus assembly protein PilX